MEELNRNFPGGERAAADSLEQARSSHTRPRHVCPRPTRLCLAPRVCDRARKAGKGERVTGTWMVRDGWSDGRRIRRGMTLSLVLSAFHGGEVEEACDEAVDSLQEARGGAGDGGNAADENRG